MEGLIYLDCKVFVAWGFEIVVKGLVEWSVILLRIVDIFGSVYNFNKNVIFD